MSEMATAAVGAEGVADEVVAVVPPSTPGLLTRLRKIASEKMSYALADQVVFSLGNLAVAAILRRHVVERDFGIYILTQRSLDVMIQLCNVCCWAPFVYNLPQMAKQGERREHEFLGSILLQQMISCVLMAVLFAGLMIFCSTPSRGLYYGTFAPLVLTAGGIVFREFNRRMYFAQMRFRVAFWTDVVTNGVQAAGVYVLWVAHRLTVANTLWVLCGGACLVSAYWLVAEWRTFRLNLAAAWTDFVNNMRLGRWFFGSNMLFTVSAQTNPWVLSGMIGGASVGDYATCEFVTNIPRVALTSMQNIMAPMMARAFAGGGKAQLNKIVLRIDRLLLAGSIVCAAVIMLAGPWVAKLIFKNVPGNARLILIVLSLNLVAFSASLAKTYGLSAINKAGLTFYANAAGLVAQLATCYWLVHAYRVPGAAAALLMGTAVVAVVRSLFYNREMKPHDDPSAALGEAQAA